HIEYRFIRHGYEPVNRIIKDFSFVILYQNAVR
ncbi:MAG: hypothetical protein ACI9CU_001002, partial [Polaribacter sp.]